MVQAVASVCGDMSVKTEPPFKIHVAKAKDLPLSWYELVLRPDKFAAHLEALKSNTESKSLLIMELTDFWLVFLQSYQALHISL